MKNRLLLGILAMVLVFGMSVVGCDDGSTKDDDNGGNIIDTTPVSPTGLSGTADGNSVQLTWQSVENASVYSVEFRKGYGYDYQAVDNITSTSYTVTGLDSNADYDFRVAAQNAKGEKSIYSSTITVKTSDAKTGTVSIKALNTTHSTRTMNSTLAHSYTIEVELELSK